MRTIVGITGKIGAGKSTLIKSLCDDPNIQVFDCDAVVMSLYDDPHIKKQLNDKFKSADRDTLRALFIKQQNTIHLHDINKIFARPIYDFFIQWVRGRQGVILIDAPMLFENDMDGLCDVTIQLSATAATRLTRIEDRSERTGELFNLINAHQWSDARREEKADFTLNTETYVPVYHIVYLANQIIDPYLPKVAIYAGSFDPITKGHLDIIEKAAILFDILYVAVGINEQKTHLLTSKTRMELIETETSHLTNINIVCYSDVLLAAARRCGASYMVRGIRNEADVINEMSMNGIHNAADSSIQTIFIPADPKYQYVSSSAAKVLLTSHTSNDPKGVVDVSWMISDNVRQQLMIQQIHDHSNDNSVTANS